MTALLLSILTLAMMLFVLGFDRDELRFLSRRALFLTIVGYDRLMSALGTGAAMSARTDGLLAGREASEILQAGLEKLSPELRETLILRDLEEMEYREIAQVLNVPEGTVKSRLNRGRAELARVLRKHKVAV